MSGQWEVVGKKKEKSNKSAAPKSGNETNRKKNNVHADVKIEDILAKSQVKNLYANDKNKENRQGEKKPQENGQKKTAQKKPEKSQEVPKPKPPKSIESALNLIDVGEFKSVFETNKSHFPSAPIVWLKELATFLNQKVAVDVPDPVFAFKPQNYPLSVVPSAIKIVIENATKEAGKDNAQLFFDIALTAMATDMSKNLPSLGFKLFLQHIASSEPQLVATRLTKHAELRNSYQNRANIGLSIFWAIGQAGFKDFQVGIKIFQEFMLPLIELKNYSRFVVKYLLDVINVSKNVSLTKEQYLVILETIFCNRKNFPTDLKQNLLDVVDGLKPLLFNKINKQDKLGGFVEFFLKKIANNNNKSYQHCLCDVVVEYFQRDETSMETWNKIYSKNVTSSAILLNYIDKNWKTISNKINKKSFAKIVNDISSTNTELMQKKKREEGLTDSVAVIKDKNINHKDHLIADFGQITRKLL